MIVNSLVWLQSINNDNNPDEIQPNAPATGEFLGLLPDDNLPYPGALQKLGGISDIEQFHLHLFCVPYIQTVD